MSLNLFLLFISFNPTIFGNNFELLSCSLAIRVHLNCVNYTLNNPNNRLVSILIVCLKVSFCFSSFLTFLFGSFNQSFDLVFDLNLTWLALDFKRLKCSAAIEHCTLYSEYPPCAISTISGHFNNNGNNNSKKRHLYSYLSQRNAIKNRRRWIPPGAKMATSCSTFLPLFLSLCLRSLFPFLLSHNFALRRFSGDNQKFDFYVCVTVFRSCLFGFPAASSSFFFAKLSIPSWLYPCPCRCLFRHISLIFATLCERRLAQY